MGVAPSSTAWRFVSSMCSQCSTCAGHTVTAWQAEAEWLAMCFLLLVQGAALTGGAAVGVRYDGQGGCAPQHVPAAEVVPRHAGSHR
jgi:hypothetical protein